MRKTDLHWNDYRRVMMEILQEYALENSWFLFAAGIVTLFTFAVLVYAVISFTTRLNRLEEKVQQALGAMARKAAETGKPASSPALKIQQESRDCYDPEYLHPSSHTYIDRPKERIPTPEPSYNQDSRVTFKTPGDLH
jgi:hypothetical protein